MKIYQVIHNNGEAYEDNYEYSGGTYTTREEAEKEILHGGYMIRDDWSNPYREGRYIVDELAWANEVNIERAMDTFHMDEDDEVTPEECTDCSSARIEEIELLEVFNPEEEVAE